MMSVVVHAFAAAWLRSALSRNRNLASSARDRRARWLDLETRGGAFASADASLEVAQATREWHAAESRAHRLELRLVVLASRALARRQARANAVVRARPLGSSRRWVELARAR